MSLQAAGREKGRQRILGIHGRRELIPGTGCGGRGCGRVAQRGAVDPSAAPVGAEYLNVCAHAVLDLHFVPSHEFAELEAHDL
ncbi:MAG: hypothetical protein ABIQ17_03995, partial [Candidatus Limnocylindrales bacterium]